MTNDQTVTQALEPCPFCGGEAEEATSKGPTGERYRWAQCTDCGAMSECCDDSARHNNPDEPEPIDLWNTRIAHSGEGRSKGAGEEVARIVNASGPVVIDWMGEVLAWRPLDHGTWTPLAALAQPEAGGER